MCEFTFTATTTGPLDSATPFITVTGDVLVTSVVAEVTETFSSGDGILLTDNNGNVLFSTQEASSLAVGNRTSYTLGGSPPSVQANGWSTGLAPYGMSVLMSAGTISAAIPPVGGSGAGAVEWTFTYRPLAPGAALVAA